MALTIAKSFIPTRPAPALSGDRRRAIVKWTLSGTYVTNGHAYAASDFGLGNVEYVRDAIFRNGTSAIVMFWDDANKRVMFYWQTNVATSALIEVANGTSLASYAGFVEAEGWG